ncbi:MAG: hypothetical protein RBR15_05615 [Sphaerochaeta sp.]|nr:hypothetical protein [Sphaerochaeta sp.]
MSVFTSIMQGLDEAVEYQEGKNQARKTKATLKPVDMFTSEEIKQIRLNAGLSQVIFTSSIGVSPKLSKPGSVEGIYPKAHLAGSLS